jgi:hypothetical protein
VTFVLALLDTLVVIVSPRVDVRAVKNTKFSNNFKTRTGRLQYFDSSTRLHLVQPVLVLSISHPADTLLRLHPPRIKQIQEQDQSTSKTALKICLNHPPPFSTSLRYSLVTLSSSILPHTLAMTRKKKVKAPSSSSSSAAANDADAARHRATVTKTIEALTCVCCLEVTTPPLYQCRNGHTLPCTDCRFKLVNQRECPICKAKVDETRKIKNLSLEQSAADIEIECKRGCGRLIAYSNLARHERDCDCVGRVAVSCLGCGRGSTLWSAAIAHHVLVSKSDSSSQHVLIFHSPPHLFPPLS